MIKTYGGKVPLIDPIKDMKITDDSLEKAITKKTKLEKSRETLESEFGVEKIQVINRTKSTDETNSL